MQQQIEGGMSEEEIRATWKPAWSVLKKCERSI
jgi:hypothetical protein